MTRTQGQKITAALRDVKGWVRDWCDALIVLLILLVIGLVLFNALRAGLS